MKYLTVQYLIRLESEHLDRLIRIIASLKILAEE